MYIVLGDGKIIITYNARNRYIHIRGQLRGHTTRVVLVKMALPRWQNEIAIALIHVTVHLSRDVQHTEVWERRETGVEREREILSELSRTPTGPHKKKICYNGIYIQYISYKGVVEINTHRVSVLKSNGPFRDEMRFLIKSHWLFIFSVRRHDPTRERMIMLYNNNIHKHERPITPLTAHDTKSSPEALPENEI